MGIHLMLTTYFKRATGGAVKEGLSFTSDTFAGRMMRASVQKHVEHITQVRPNSLVAVPARSKSTTIKRINRTMLERKYMAWRNSTWMQSWSQVFGNQAILQSDGDKPPKGFEKFFKNRRNKEAKESSADDDKKEEERKE